MKEIIMVMDEDPFYCKRFCNQANKLYGKKYTFLTFSNLKLLKDYSNENKVESLILTEPYLEYIDDVKVKSIYILNEKERKLRREGKRTFIYKLQNVQSILEVVDADISKKNEKNKGKVNDNCKLLLYYSPMYIKNKYEIVKRIAKGIIKKKKVLIVDLDEFENYKGNVGLSNIIFEYKENMLSDEKLRKEVINDKELELVKSVTYPEDFNVISNIDLANIINELVKLGYDYVFINADMSYTKCQYILNDADSLILMRDKETQRGDSFKAYLKNENQFDLKKVTEFDVSKLNKPYLSAFCKQLIAPDSEKV